MRWVQYLIIALAIGGPVLGRVLQTVEKKRKERQAQKESDARRHEALRTGRSTPQVSVGAPVPAAKPAARSATERMQELARKRQQQLEELRRRQQAARQSGGRSQQLPPARGQRPAPTAKPTARTTPRPQTPPTLSQAPRQVKRPQVARPGARQQRVVPRTTESDRSKTSIHELKIDEHVLHPSTEAPLVTPVKILGKTMDASDWRRFIIARELLDPPLALRKPGGGGLL